MEKGGHFWTKDFLLYQEKELAESGVRQKCKNVRLCRKGKPNDSP